GGTIFLDEVGELPMSLQAKLLRVLENGEIIPVGSSVPQRVDVRVVAATNVDIEQAVRNGKFRQDLYYRLCQISIKVPALRERREDIFLLFRKFAADVADRQHTDPIRLTDDAKEYLVNYPWYGNIRELKHFAESISVLEYERTINKETLQKYLKYSVSGSMPTVYNNGDGNTEMSDRELLLRVLSMGNMIHELHNEINDLKNTISGLVRGGIPVGQPITQHQVDAVPTIIPPHDDMPVHYIPNTDEPEEFAATEVIEDEPLALEEREKRAILKALEKHHGNRKPAAADLNISERTLYRKLKKYGIE
ncbi:MAG: sigma-54-dependent Fis family transcriptional regulator, partial [Bacteroidales bacterium]|nr:sigma-54-dependent Fis family transcriptional regulator [Bacteroidales bacterium]